MTPFTYWKPATISQAVSGGAHSYFREQRHRE